MLADHAGTPGKEGRCRHHGHSTAYSMEQGCLLPGGRGQGGSPIPALCSSCH